MNTFCDEVMDEAGGIAGYEGTLEAPCFSSAGKVHDWRNHVPDFLRDNWHRMSLEARVVVYLCARQGADREDWD